jgi:hypothetical protein
MNDLDLLHDDHLLLSSQVVHVSSLIESMDARLSVSLQSEVLRQIEILRQQLQEHFTFEEEEAFPRLRDKYPTFQGDLQRLLEQHKNILSALEELRALPWAQSSGISTREAADRCSSFEAAFASHASEENALLQELTILVQ